MISCVGMSRCTPAVIAMKVIMLMGNGLDGAITYGERVTSTWDSGNGVSCTGLVPSHGPQVCYVPTHVVHQCV